MFFKIGNKKPEYYKSYLIRADPGLHEQVAKEIQNNVHTGHLLDMGAGDGAFSQRLVDLGFSVVATDIDSKKYKCDNAEFVKLDFNNLNEINNFTKRYKSHFDVVVSLEVIEHIENPWEHIRILKMLLKKNGLLIITTPNTTSWYSRLQFLFTGKFHQFDKKDLEYGHISPITFYELNHIVTALNFKNITIKPAGQLPILWINKNPKVLFFNFISLFLRLFMGNIKDGWCILLSGKKS